MATFPGKDRFSHKKSKYDRPTLNYRCGRGQMWGKPCQDGPDASGTCRGIAECRPAKKDDRWQCRRPSGACEQGPNPDGSCCLTQAACSPVPTIRLYRKRAVILGLLMAAAILIALVVYSEQSPASASSDEVAQAGQPFDPFKVSIINPGDLSDLHSAFINGEGCQSCHVSEQAHSGMGVLAGTGLHSLSSHEALSDGCVSCHTFAGPARSPHNSASSSRELECRSCHTEHQGRFANLTEISNQQCATCHEQKFASFKNHPAFDSKFPYLTAGSIVFDHRKHLEFHFEKAKDPATVPKTCTSCHDPKGAKSSVPIKSFESTCSACHEKNINDSAKAELELLSLPAIKLKGDEEIAKFKECGATEGKRFKGAGKSRSNPFTDWLLGYRLKQSEEYAEAYCGLLQDLQSKGLAGLVAKFKKRSGIDGQALFSGLTPELIAVLTEQWIQDERYRPASKTIPKGFMQSGWSVNKKGELNYHPAGHSDKVTLSWLEFAWQLRKSQANDELANRLADSILDHENGFGACMKCHLPSPASDELNDEGGGAIKLAIKVQKNATTPHRFKFSHSAHLRFVGAGTAGLDETGVGCALCHKLNPESSYLDTVRLENQEHGYESNFNSLEKETCAQCHNAKSIQDDCTTCHEYHESPGFTPKLNASLGSNR